MYYIIISILFIPPHSNRSATMNNSNKKAVKTRDLLIQTAGKLFTLHGVKGVQAKDIAQAAGSCSPCSRRCISSRPRSM